jgi:hypothetical protein
LTASGEVLLIVSEVKTSSRLHPALSDRDTLALVSFSVGADEGGEALLPGFPDLKEQGIITIRSEKQGDIAALTDAADTDDLARKVSSVALADDPRQLGSVDRLVRFLALARHLPADRNDDERGIGVSASMTACHTPRCGISP